MSPRYRIPTIALALGLIIAAVKDPVGVILFLLAAVSLLACILAAVDR